MSARDFMDEMATRMERLRNGASAEIIRFPLADVGPTMKRGSVRKRAATLRKLAQANGGVPSLRIVPPKSHRDLWIDYMNYGRNDSREEWGAIYDQHSGSIARVWTTEALCERLVYYEQR